MLGDHFLCVQEIERCEETLGRKLGIPLIGLGETQKETFVCVQNTDRDPLHPRGTAAASKDVVYLVPIFGVAN